MHHPRQGDTPSLPRTTKEGPWEWRSSKCPKPRKGGGREAGREHTEASQSIRICGYSPKRGPVADTRKQDIMNRPTPHLGRTSSS